MRFSSSHLWLGFCLILLGSGWAVPARADVEFTARAISVPGVKLSTVTVHLSDRVEGGIHLQLSAKQADVAAMGWRKVGLTLEGDLQRDEDRRWVLDGQLQLRGAPGGALGDATLRLVSSENTNTIQIDLAQGKAKASAALPLDQPTHAQITLTQLPVVWLRGLLGTVWSGHPTGGRLDAKLALDLRDEGLQSSGQFTLNGVGFDTPAGTLAAEGLGGSGRFGLDTTSAPSRIHLDASMRGGELLLGPIYASLPDHPVQLGLNATAQQGAFALEHLRVNDADALQLEGALAFDANGELKQLRLDRLHAAFPAAYERYGRAWLATLGLRDVQLNGQVNASVDLRANGLRAFAFTTDGLDLADADGRVAVSDMRGGLDWAVAGNRPATTLRWNQLQFYRLPTGGGQSRWQSRDGALALQQPVDMTLLQGNLHLGEFSWRPAAASGQRLSTAINVTGVDMAAFSQAMGWPKFPGTLGGAIPSLKWVDDRVELAGGLSVSLFGGFADITQLSLQQPFGPSPVLAADVKLSQLDLGAITSVFDFGSITGKLDGSIDDLRLVNWKPVAFKARLLADDGGRISQRAVNNLTSVGGGGIAAGLQGAVLKLFKTFGYKRIGLNCTLKGSVCQMSGLERDEGGYTIVEGSGLPRLQVIGHQTEVDWPTLVSRLQEAIAGNAPEVR